MTDDVQANEYETSNLTLAAFLLARGFRVLRTKESGTRWKSIVFDRAAEAVAPEYFTGGMVGAQSLIHAHRDIRSMVRFGFSG